MNSMIDDAELLRRYAQDSSEEAFAELVRRHINLVYSAALRRVGNDSHLAEDVSQRVFSDLARKADSLAIRSALAGWLYTRARSIAVDIVRSEQRRRRREQQAQALNTISSRQPTMNDWNQLRPVLEETIDALKPCDREAILLRFFEHRPLAEIGAVLCLSEDAIQKRVERSLEKLRGLLAKRGVTSTTAALALVLADNPAVAAPAALAANVTGVALASSTTAFAALKLMSTTKTTVGIAALIGILALGSALRETAVLHRTTALLASADQESKILEGRARQLTQSTQGLEDSLTALRPRVATGLSGSEATNGESSRAAANTSVSTAFASDYLNHRMHDLVGKLVAWNNTNYFGPLLRSAGLSDAQVARAEYLLGQKETFAGLDSNPLSYKTDPRSSAEINAELAQVIGEAGAASLSTYQIVRFVTDGLAGNLYGSEEPLTPEQASQLTQIMVGTNQGTASPGSWLNPQSTDWSAAISQAQGVLSPNQLAVFKNIAISSFGADIK
jgi:RNA polymerase sigma factor (sigma-70 family)